MSADGMRGAATGAMTLGRWTTDRAAASGARVAIHDRGVEVTYAELEARVSLLASSLEEAGHGRGSRIATITGSTADHVVLLFACAKAGIALVPLSWRLRAAEIAAQLRIARPSLVLVEDEFERLALAALALSGAAVPLAQLGASGIEHAVPAAIEPRPADTPADDDPLLVLCTSGTSGAPKAVVLSHAACWWTNLSLSKTIPITAGDTVLQVLPQHHVAGWNVQPLLAWWNGATVVLERTFDAGRALALVERHRVTATMGVPATYRSMAQHPDFSVRDLSTLRTAVVGGDLVDDAVRQAWARRDVRLLQGYGLTEAGPNVLAVGPGDDAPRGSVGRPYPHVDVAVRDVDGRAILGPGVGELHVHGPAVFLGYLDDEERTARVLQDGWLATGDLVRRDAAGWYTVVDRIKDLVRSGAETIAPVEVERALLAVPGVVDAAVAGVADADWGEALVAWVVAPSLDDEALRAALSERIAAFKVPKRFVRVTDIPRSAAGKTLRRMLAASLEAGRVP